MEAWTRGALKPWLLDLSASRSFLENSAWNGPAVKAAVERAVSGEARMDPVWPVLNAYVLEKTFKARAKNLATIKSPSLDSNSNFQERSKSTAIGGGHTP